MNVSCICFFILTELVRYAKAYREAWLRSYEASIVAKDEQLRKLTFDE